MIITVDTSKMNFNGCTQSVRREIEAIHELHLEKDANHRMLHPQKKEWKFSKYFFFINKMSPLY